MHNKLDNAPDPFAYARELQAKLDALEEKVGPRYQVLDIFLPMIIFL